MNTQDATITSMVWCPEMIMVHQVPHQGVPGMEITAAFVDPSAIQSIYEAATKSSDGEYGKTCTVIQMKTRDYLYVTELPEVIANLRDESFGYKARPPVPKDVFGNEPAMFQKENAKRP